MLDSFRKRGSPLPTGPGALTPRATAPAPQLRVPEPEQDAARLEQPPSKPILGDSLEAAAPPAALPPNIGSATKEPAAKNTAVTARLIVGPDINLKGAEITNCDTLIVEGQVDACMNSRVIEVAEHGIFRGKVNVDIAEIRGSFEGELSVHKQLMIRAGGRVVGKVRYVKMLIDEGGELSGDVAKNDMTNTEGLARGTALTAPVDYTLDKLSEPHPPREAAPAGSVANRTPSIAAQR
jgi:cytoskeletal protein CcmA (bactofilin family)